MTRTSCQMSRTTHRLCRCCILTYLWDQVCRSLGAWIQLENAMMKRETQLTGIGEARDLGPCSTEIRRFPEPITGPRTEK